MNKSNWYCHRPIAHRGLHCEDVPENSLLSFEKAIQAGFPIEIDVHLLKDGRLVVFHDEELSRMTGDPRPLYQLSSDEACRLKLKGGQQTIPRFEDVLALVKGEVPLLIELKCAHSDGMMETALSKALKGYQGEYAVQSFNPLSLLWFRRHAPGVTVGLLSGSLIDEDLTWYKRFVLRHLLILPRLRPDFVGYHFENLKDPAPRLARQVFNTPLLAWTIRSAKAAQDSAAWCDNIIFEGFQPLEREA